MLRRRKEKQSLVDASRQALEEAQNKAEVEAKIIDAQRARIEKLTSILSEISNKVTSNTYGNAEIVLNKIKELVKDFEGNY